METLTPILKEPIREVSSYKKSSQTPMRAEACSNSLQVLLSLSLSLGLPQGVPSDLPPKSSKLLQTPSLKRLWLADAPNSPPGNFAVAA